MELESIFKLSTRFLCFLGLFLQTSQLFYEYWQGKTVVNIEIDRKEDVPLPGITICYYDLFSIEKISHLDRNYENEFKMYRSLLNSTNVENVTEFQAHLRAIYTGVISNILDKINNNAFDLKTMLENYSINFKDNLIKILLDEFIVEEDDSRFSNSDDHPLESYNVLFNNGEIWPHKCFTFFSALNKTWRTFRKNTKSIYLRIDHDNNLFPHSIYRNIQFALHSPNTLPTILGGNYHFLTFGKTFTVMYSRIFTRLLGNNYDTDCFEYDLDYNYSTFNMRSDCVTWCYQREVNKLCHSQAHIYSGDLFRREVWYQAKNMTFEHCFKNDTDKILAIYSSCYKQCPKDCSFEYYSKDIKSVLSNVNLDRIKIILFHSDMPDITVNYVPDMTLLSLICNFGGLLGMWLGLSLLVMFEDFKNIVTKIIQSRKTNNILNQFNFVLNTQQIISSPNQQDNVKIDRRRRFRRVNIKVSPAIQTLS